MSILIKGMEMPQSCLDCPFKQFLLLGERNICLANMGKLFKYTDFSERDKNCPLVPLPEKHGRLIDADALIAELHKYFEDCCGRTTLEMLIKHAPTIIPAEGGGEDG